MTDVNIGDKFGEWTVISEQFKKNGKYYVTCECSCEKHTIRDVQKTYLINNRSKCCGCKKHYSVNDGMVGKRFGKLTVVKRVKSQDNNSAWRCLCDCGNETIVKGFRLRTGHTKSCGNCNHVGEIINGIKLLSRIHGAWYECRCPHCGNKFVEIYSRISSGHIKSCGCKANKFIDMSGQRFGNWQVIAPTENKKFWLCECSCEKHTKKIVSGASLRNGVSTSCGCKSINFGGSVCENEIRDFVADIVEDVPQKIKILCNNSREIDLYYKNYAIGIEYNGSACHASINNQYRDSNKSIDYHLQKFLSAKELGIHLINIFDIDWENNQNKIKEYLKHLFVCPIIVHVEECKLSPVLKYEADSFCNLYHMDNECNRSEEYFGLYFNDELLVIMTFSKQEITRYCTKFGYFVVGGAARILSSYVDRHSYNVMRTFTNNDFYTGSVFDSLGFICTGTDHIQYYWYKNDKELPLSKQCSDNLFSLYPNEYNKAVSLSCDSVEDYIMKNLRARKVYRSGITKWVKYYN